MNAAKILIANQYNVRSSFFFNSALTIHSLHALSGFLPHYHFPLSQNPQDDTDGSRIALQDSVSVLRLFIPQKVYFEMIIDHQMTIVELVRYFKESVTSKHGFDVARIIHAAPQRQEASGRRIIRRGEQTSAGQLATCPNSDGDDYLQLESERHSH
jgi:hypothetical protein